MRKMVLGLVLLLAPLVVLSGPPVSPCDASGNCATYDSSGRVGIQPGSNPCASPGATLVSVTGSTSGTTAVEVVAASAGAKVYVCSMNIVGVSGTTPTFSLVQGTGTNCATGQTVLVQAWQQAANTLYSFHGPVAVSGASNAVCYLQTGTTPVNRYTLTYVRQ